MCTSCRFPPQAVRKGLLPVLRVGGGHFELEVLRFRKLGNLSNGKCIVYTKGRGGSWQG